MISVNKLKKSYGRGTGTYEEVLRGISLTLPDKGFVCILGRSGTGKTSLLNAVGGLDTFDSGTLDIDGSKITRAREMETVRNERFGYVFQNYYLLPEHSAAYNVYLGLHSVDLPEKEKLKRVADALEKVGMLRFRKRLVGELSGGQQQRIAIARAIVKEPEVIFADEPTGNLDEESTINICSLLKELSATNLVVMVTHEERLAYFFADRIIKIDAGTVAEDITAWERGPLDSPDGNTVYAGEYQEEVLSTGGVKLRILTAENASPADISVVIEDGRVIIKTDDSRLIAYARKDDPPFIKEGKRPGLELPVSGVVKEDASAGRLPQKKKALSGLGLKMLYSEMKTTSSKKKLKNAASVLFLVLLSVMLLFSISDLMTAARIDPEEFITSDSHILALSFDKDENFDSREVLSVNEYIPAYFEFLTESGCEIDFIPNTNQRFRFFSREMPQYGTLSMSLGSYNLVNLSRLDPSTLVYGRMPERYDEIVVDKWVLSKATDVNGILQNMIPDNGYMLGKVLKIGKRYSPKIVGICDSGEPDVYISTLGLLNIAVYGVDAITYSEFVSITGMTDAPVPDSGKGVVIYNDDSSYYTTRIGGLLTLKNRATLRLAQTVLPVDDSFGITAPVIIADEDLDRFFTMACSSATTVNLWCADKEKVKAVIASSMPGELKNVITVDVRDTYQQEYDSFMNGRISRIQTRVIIMGAIGLLSLVMLYVTQRLRVRDRLGLIAVYRLLGIPGRDSIAIFILENLIMTLKYALPAILLSYAVVNLLPLLGVGGLTISVSLRVAFLTFGIIVAAEIILAIIATVRLTLMPPAKLAVRGTMS